MNLSAVALHFWEHRPRVNWPLQMASDATIILPTTVRFTGPRPRVLGKCMERSATNGPHSVGKQVFSGFRRAMKNGLLIPAVVTTLSRVVRSIGLKPLERTMCRE